MNLCSRAGSSPALCSKYQHLYYFDMSETITFAIVCGKCGSQTGEVELPKKKWEKTKPTNKLLGIESSTCDGCLKKAKKK